ncbi:hypothetical protein [Kocuria flava]|uniref:hypothetical protein n=1 Tax=Kocuria flava TaxID=446860 RepID=UPI002150EFE6|nr:hypothetical protein [Kocuria flava]
MTGTPAEVGRRLARLLEDTGADELMVTGGAADPEAQERSDRLLAELAGAPA